MNIASIMVYLESKNSSLFLDRNYWLALEQKHCFTYLI